MRRKKILIPLLFLFSSISAKSNNRLFLVHDKDSYMLSESNFINSKSPYLNKSDLKSELNFKTIFIWQEDFAYRIVCYQVKKAELNNHISNSSTTIDLKSFLNLVFMQKESTTFDDNYEYKFVEKYNNLAKNKDFNIEQTSENTIVTKIKNDLNIPIVFKNFDSDSCYELTPLYINVYVSNNKRLSLVDLNLKGSIFLYGMLSNIYNTVNSFKIDNELKEKLEKSTLKTILSCKLKINAIKSAIDSLSTYNLTPQKFHNIDSSGLILDNNCTSYGNLPSEENICKIPLICMHQYEYDCYCYNTSISKSLRIYNHCPITINSYNHIFLYYISDHLILKSESTSNCESCDNKKQWQLSIPNIGYWIENIRNDNQGNFFIPDLSSNRFKINQLNVSDFLIK